MNIIERAKTKSNIEIMLEEWDSGLQIGAYPIAKDCTNWVRAGETFRLTISSNKYQNYFDEDVKADFEALKNGTKTLADLSKHFWYGERDKKLLGI